MVEVSSAAGLKKPEKMEQKNRSCLQGKCVINKLPDGGNFTAL